MTLTNPTDFKTFFSMIPKERQDNLWFFPVRQNKKNPDVPGGTILKGNLSYRISYQDCIKRLKWGKNVGIYAVPGGLMFLDLDVKNKALIASQEFLQQINPTLTIRSRNGGYQFYYWNSGKYPNQIIQENGVNIGELRTDWYYVVGVGSYVVPDENNFNGDGTYRIVSEHPISEFKPFGNYFKTSKDDNKEVKTFSKETKPGDRTTVKEYNENLKGKNKVRRELSFHELQYIKISRGL